MGSFMPIDLGSKSPAEGLFSSHAAIDELVRLESLLNRLAPPSWPENIFGKIDREKAKAGKALFMEYCSGCHNAWPYRWTEPNRYGKRFILVGLVPQTYVGTDRAQARTVRPFAITGELSKNLPSEFRGKDVLPTGIYNAMIRSEIIETALKKRNLTEAELINLHGYRELPSPPAPDDVYKAAPRDGVWATPPFMHNGSVPNLYALLSPVNERPAKFYLGNREYDPVNVGYRYDRLENGFELDTRLRGNTNTGHEFNGDGSKQNQKDGVIGRLLTPQERRALVEFLKTM